MENQSRILLIDPSPAIEPIIRRHLEGEAVSIHSACTAAEGLERARRLDPDLILLDVDLPDADAFEVLKHIKGDAQLMRAAVLLMAAPAAQSLKLRALDLGAFDYLHKPFDPAELRARVRSALRMQFLARLLSARSMIDGVTGLRNRAYFDQRLRQEMSLAIRSGHPCSCILLDIDGFTRVNETWGHRVGDDVLRQVAAILTGTCRAEDILCRHGGGQFVVLAPNTPGEKIANLAERMRARLESTEIPIRGGNIRVTASFGIADLSAAGAEQTLESARAALHQAKSAGGNQIVQAADLPNAQTRAA